MRKITCAITILLAATAPAACGGSGESTGSGGGGAADDVTGTAKNLYQPSTGDVVRPDTSWTTITIEALVDQAGALKSYPGTIDAQGDLRIPGVPVGPYLLTLTSPPSPTLPGAQPLKSFFATAARTIDLGQFYSGRPDLQSMTKPTYLTLQATLGVPWQAYTDGGMGGVLQPFDDRLQLISRNGSVTGLVFAGASAPGDNAPVNAAKELAGWKINAQDAFSYLGNLTLVDGGKGDDFTVLHDVMKQVGMPTPDGNPWSGYVYTSTQEALQPAPFTMTDGGTTTLTGAFQTAPQKSFAMDFKGSAFNALFAGVPISFSSASISLLLEAGTPNPEYGAFATLLEMSVATGTAFTNPDPACQTDVGCDPVMCPNGCDAGTSVPPGDHAHMYSYGNPFEFGQELVDVSVQVYQKVRTLLPEQTSENLRGGFFFQAPASEITGKPIQPVVGLPQDIKVAGKGTPYDQVTKAVGTAPMITWSAPSLGKPTRYEVLVVDLTDVKDVNDYVVRHRNVARIAVTSPNVQIPDGVLKAGKYYYLQVTAEVQDDDDLAAPFKIPVHQAYATMFTGVVTP